ncbi:type I-E CRISPR-associated protein Cas5/CasD [Pararhodobacter sp.]|uniref:type I-E CRISPR-associated protein Cas5/CasD n=1 Tax=Pararhodobacter sp. TaxID=2127056 RepID=UPI002AFF90E5|nr:type I-E CRISPR-associated protein Cas5/CasD [Pararhodobacter sp.]
MPEHLVFTLTAALGAMGDLAGHERRGSLAWPGRSAILGLLAAALGIRRDGDFAALDALGVAVAVFDEGVPLRDFHTAQTVPSAAVKRPQSRPEALALAGLKVNTTISLRDYRAGSLFGVVVWGAGLAALRDALDRPVFTLYLGRKSCPLAAPVGARLIEAETPEAALDALHLPPWRRGAVARMLACDADQDATGAGRIETRHDQPRDRALWHFEARHVRLRAVAIAPGSNPRGDRA